MTTRHECACVAQATAVAKLWLAIVAGAYCNVAWPKGAARDGSDLVEHIRHALNMDRGKQYLRGK